MDKKSIDRYMAMALELAAKAEEKTYPNPMVGAVILKGSKVIGKGYHRRAGGDHAEIRAIKNARNRCEGASMFVTLEPCNHQGKTPPCTDAIIKSGISKVVIGIEDPNPKVSGFGIGKLVENNIDVEVGFLENEINKQLEYYLHFVKYSRPFFIMKNAVSLDGKIGLEYFTKCK